MKTETALDFQDIEKVKQEIINRYQEAGFTLSRKPVKSKLGGYYVYHPFGYRHTKRKQVSILDKIIRCDFIEDCDIESFESHLQMALREAQIRKEG